MAQTIVGVFADRNDAGDAIKEMEDRGLNPKDFSIIMKDSEEGKQLAKDTGADVASGVAGGAVSGAVIGGIAGLVASFLIPGLGAFFIGGPIAAALGLTGAAATTASGAATGAVAGGIIGAFNRMGMNDNEAHEYEQSIKEGGIFVAVPVTDAEANDIKGIFQEHHASQVRDVSTDEKQQEEYAAERSYQHNQSSYGFSGAKGGESKKDAGKSGKTSSKAHEKKHVKKVKEIEYE